MNLFIFLFNGLFMKKDWRFWSVLMLTVVLLGACGGGDDDNKDSNDDSDRVSDSRDRMDDDRDQDDEDEEVEEDVEWEVYERSDFGYQVEFPDEPDEDEQSQLMEDGQEITIYLALYESGPSSGYMVSYNTYPEEYIFDDIEAAYDGAIEKAAESFGEVVDEDDIVLGDVSGKEVYFSGIFEARVNYYLKDNKLYQILVLSDDVDDLEDEDAEYFFSSFEFI